MQTSPPRHSLAQAVVQAVTSPLLLLLWALSHALPTLPLQHSGLELIIQGVVTGRVVGKLLYF